MKIENSPSWIEIEFICYAEDDIIRSSNLFEEKNCVKIDFNFNVADVGWGFVWDEYFTTADIYALSNGFQKVLSNTLVDFSYSGNYPYESLTPNPFYTFFIKRRNDNVEFKLKIHDRLEDYISVTQVMSVSCFEKIADEFLEAAKKFPIKR